MTYTQFLENSMETMKRYMEIVEQRPQEFKDESEYKQYCIKELDADLRMCCGARDVLRFRELEVQDGCYVYNTFLETYRTVRYGIYILKMDGDRIPVDKFESRVKRLTKYLREACEELQAISERTDAPTEDLDIEDVISRRHKNAKVVG